MITDLISGDMAIKDLSPKDANSGGRIIKNMRICGSGLYEYLTSEAPLMGLQIPEDYHGDTFKIFRSPEVLEANKDLYARVPIITGHHVRVNTANAKQLAVGMVGDTVKSEIDPKDGELYLYTTGTIITGDGIDAYERLGELSVGYDPIVEWKPGTYKGQAYQAILKGFNEINHLLICQTARGGHQCMIMDELIEPLRFKKILSGGKSMGLFSKIFGSNKPMSGDARVVEVLLDSIKAGANPATQVAAVRSIMGDSKDETFSGFLDELSGITGDEDKAVVAKAVDIVKDYYTKNIAGDEDKEVIVKKDGDKKDVEVKKDGKETKDIEVKKDGDKKDVEVKETGDKDEKKETGDGCGTGDSIDYDRIINGVVAKLNATKSAGDEKPHVEDDTTVMTGDAGTSASGLTSDSIMEMLKGGK